MFNFEQTKILVIGDVMLDQYWHGGTSRISPEAPVPIVHVNRMDERPGGAANVALGIAALGAFPHLIGLLGKDLSGLTLEQLLLQYDISSSLEKVSSHGTITKLRVLSRNQQMIRLDTERPFLKEDALRLEESYMRALDDVNMVLLSDYGKGTLANSVALIAMARAKNIPVVVDPKSLDFAVYHGATVVTPNLKEFEAVVGPCESVEILEQKALQLLNQYEIEAIVITRSEHGLSVILRNGEINHIPTVAREVHDVTGAGDTVIAVLAVALASGMSLVEAAALGNIAAGIAVGKFGAATVSREELETALKMESLAHALPLGVMTEEALIPILEMSKAKGEKIVFTNGCFDILHSGHVLYLEQARALGDRVIIGVNDNDSVARLKGPTRPINGLEDRMHVLAGLRSVDWVVPFSEDTPERLIKALSPDVLVKGGDYKDPESLAGARFVLSQGGEVKILGLKEGVSTTRTIAAINNTATVEA